MTSVVVTGLGLITPLGADRESTWRALLSGTAAGRFLTSSDFHWADDLPRDLTEQWANHRWSGAPALLPPHANKAGFPVTLSADLDPVAALALLAASEAIADSDLAIETTPSERIGVVFGTSKGGLHSASTLWPLAHRHASATTDSSPNRMTNVSVESGCVAASQRWQEMWPDLAARQIAETWNFQGPTSVPVAACATGLVACLNAVRLLQQGVCDVVIAGSADAGLHPAVLGSFKRLGVLAGGEGPPSSWCRPFDRSRKGFIVGEGAACLVLERAEYAQARGARWYAEFAAGGLASDPSGLTQVDPHGVSLQQLLQRLLPAGDMPDLIHPHGTATRANDPAECRAIRGWAGNRLESLTAMSTKGSTGHLLGAAGSVELGLCLLALRDQCVPPAVNLSAIDPDCQLPFALREASHRKIEQVVKISLGFGGHQAVSSWRRRRGPGDRVRTT